MIQPTVQTLIRELEQKETGYELAFKGALFYLFAMLFRSGAAEAVERPQTDRAHKYYQRLEPAFSHIREHFAENISVDELAVLCGLSKYHFCRTFKGVTGKTAVGYINEYRLGKAEMLLTETRMRVEDIALSVGFQQASYFTRAFKALKGVTPASLRDKK
jgi:AraC-like DNA-binding protein